MPFVLDVASSDDPLIASVRYAITTYGIDAARTFVSQRGDSWGLTVKERAVQLIDRKAAAAKDERRHASAPRHTRKQAVLARTRTGVYSDVTNLAKVYGYCGSTCNLVGRVEIELRTNLYPNLYMAGDIDVRSGPAIAVPGADCRVMYDRTGWPDTTVFTWSNCEDVQSSSLYMSHHAIRLQNSSFYGSYGAKYHNTYSFRVDPLGSPPAIVLSGDSARWKNPSGGGQPTFPA